jgi:hypothetical protein
MRGSEGTGGEYYHYERTLFLSRRPEMKQAIRQRNMKVIRKRRITGPFLQVDNWVVNDIAASGIVEINKLKRVSNHL